MTPPVELMRLSLASVWLYEGLWCKVLGRMPGQEGIAAAVPGLRGGRARPFLLALGWAEAALGLWVLSGRLPWWAALAQTLLLVGMNSAGLLYARRLIHDPAGMLLKNLVLLVLAWTAAGRAGS